jgi:hypothetical protein
MMWTAIKGLFSSKKFWMVLIGSAAVGVMQYFGVSVEVIAIVAGLFGVNVLGQGIADSKKVP